MGHKVREKGQEGVLEVWVAWRPCLKRPNAHTCAGGRYGRREGAAPAWRWASPSSCTGSSCANGARPPLPQPPCTCWWPRCSSPSCWQTPLCYIGGQGCSGSLMCGIEASVQRAFATSSSWSTQETRRSWDGSWVTRFGDRWRDCGGFATQGFQLAINSHRLISKKRYVSVFLASPEASSCATA